MERAIASIEFATFSHATEDRVKVLKAVKNLLPENGIDDVEFQEEEVTGHYGNLIRIIRTTVSRKDLVDDTVKLLAKRLDSLDKSFLRREMELQGFKNRDLYMRLDKQAAYLGKVKVLNEDPIRIRFKFKLHPKGYKDFLSIYIELGLIE
jgi:RNA-binding protein